MSKILDLKDWLTLEDAAKELSQDLSEPISKADILHLAINGNITLSVNLLKYVPVLFGEIIALKDAEWVEIPLEDVEEGADYSLNNSGNPAYLKGDEIDSERIFNKTSLEVDRIKGVWDFPIGDCDKQYIEFQLHKLNENTEDDKEFMPEGTDSFFLVGPNNEIVKILINIEDVDMNGSLANGDKLEQLIKDRNLSQTDANRLLKKYYKGRRKFLERFASLPLGQNYYAANQFPEPSYLVVRTSAITDFINTHNSEAQLKEKSITVGDLKIQKKQPQIKNLTVNNTRDEELKKFVATIVTNYPEATTKDIANHCFSKYNSTDRVVRKAKNIAVDLGAEKDTKTTKRTNEKIEYMRNAPIYP